MKPTFPAFKRNLTALCFGILVLAATPIAADTLDRVLERGKLVVAIDPTFAPYEYTSDEGEIIGYSPNIMAAVAADLGVDLEYQRMSFGGIIPGLIAGSFDAEASSLNVTAERAKRILFTVPYGKTVNGVLVTANRDFVGDSLTAEDLAGKTAAVKAASTPEKILRDISAELQAAGHEAINLVTVDTVDQTISTLASGRVDFVFDDLSVLTSVQARRPGHFEIKGDLGPAQWIAWGTRLDDERLNQAISKVILELQESGQLQEWQQEYLGFTYLVPATDFIPESHEAANE